MLVATGYGATLDCFQAIVCAQCIGIRGRRRARDQQAVTGDDGVAAQLVRGTQGFRRGLETLRSEERRVGKERRARGAPWPRDKKRRGERPRLVRGSQYP